MEALDAIICCKFQRILTSGGKNSVSEGIPMLLELIEKAKDRISIMPGGGTRPEHVTVLNQNGFLKEIHASCRTITSSKTNLSIRGYHFHPSLWHLAIT